MKTKHVTWFAAWGVAISVPLAAAQGVAPGARVNRSGMPAPRMMVANPFVAGAADSAASVEIGSSFREGVQEMVGDDYAVVTQKQMNEALDQYGWPRDAILNTSLATLLAKNIQARIVVTSTLAKNKEGLYVVTARLVGVNDEAGNVSVVTQQPGERLPDFGYRIAETMRPVVKALSDAKACLELLETSPDKPEKAAKAAEKALKKVPNHGLAHYCLYDLARRQKMPAEALKQLELTVQGDPLSIRAWSLLITAYQEAKDTAHALAAAQQMLRLAPTDQELRVGLFKYLLQSGQPKAALEVVDEGIRLDSGNVALYDLKANACLAMSDLACAAEALERVYSIDSSKVDAAYFAKWIAITGGGQQVDTARLLTWSEIGARKFPENLTILRNLLRVYVMTGRVDSSLAVTRRLIARDTTAVRPALAAVQTLAQANRFAETGEFADFVKRYGNAAQKNQLAQVVVVVALSRLKGDSAAGQAPDMAAAVELARSGIALADTNGQAFQHGNFVLGAALIQQASTMDEETEKQKSCEMARQEEKLVAEAKDALSKVGLEDERIKASTATYLGYAEKFGPRISYLLKSYC